MICPKCSRQTQAEGKYCPSCGWTAKKADRERERRRLQGQCDRCFRKIWKNCKHGYKPKKCPCDEYVSVPSEEELTRKMPAEEIDELTGHGDNGD